mmetsp:Transcript_4035/g.3436  ORF Transcript_4035/g.3436 Transcript_4035/m.3436 type:complete len:97 (-) Transcript_4035:349-639(-)
MHNKDIAHMDIKCDNILIGEDFQVKICDFGDCEAVEDGAYLEGCKGTRQFIAPEILLNYSKVRDFKKADMFSLGVVLFALNLGQFPFPEKESKDGY